MRRRNNSGGLGDDGMSLLKHPSVAMARLIQSVARGSLPRNAGITEQAMRRPVLSFVMQRHDLDSLQIAMRHSLRKAACRVFALQGFNWLLRNVSMLSCIHDLLWHFVSSLSVTEERTEEEQKKELDQDAVLCEHPLWDIGLAGEVVQPLLQTFHAFLQTVSDVTMYLPPGSALQQMAVRCWCLKFRPHDHMFLHKSHVFSNISKILSKSEEGWGVTPQNALPASATKVESYRDITQAVELKASSRQAMLPSLIDGSTETFWESGDEDRNKTKTLTVVCPPHLRTEIIYLHIDNSRDLGNKVSSIVFNAGKSQEDLRKVKQFDVDVRFCGWVHCRSHGAQIVRVELKGADNTLRVRQMKILSSAEALAASANHFVMQQKGCEVETLKVFRLLTSQVFGRLIADDVAPLIEKEANLSDSCDDVDLKEHMVGILFSRNKLSHLQKQVCVHIVQAIRKETIRVQEEWEDKLQSGTSSDMDSSKDRNKMSDAYCFELLSMVLALSGSTVGCQYLSQQHHLLHDLFTLLHTASPRVQRQVTALLRRVLPEVQPQSLAAVLGVPSLPPKDFSILDKGRDPGQLGILDVFLACIAKALVVQTKVKGQGAKSAQTFKLSDCIGHNFPLGQKWWLRGSVSAQLAETIILLLKDLSAGSLSQSWVAVTKSAIAESVLTLTKLDEVQRSPAECIRTPSLWLALASLCVLDQEHVEKLSSGQWAHQAKNRPTCDNHDDGETAAIILCAECGNLCADCDRFLHLHRKTRAHQRQVFKEEEEAIKVDLHEACGRTKLFWLMALADSRTLKAMVEFRDSAKGKLGSSSVSGVCRFCGSTCNSRLMSVGYVCSQKDCQDYAAAACNRTLQCGHACGGIRDEEACLPCLHGCQQGALKQDADDMCMICFTEALSAAPAIQLKCGHVFHEQCCQHVLQQRWVGPRISFGFSLCPICKHDIEHNVLRPLLESIRVLQEDVKRKALMRLEYEGLHQAEAITAAGARFHGDPSGYALERYAYYVCYKCKKAYFGGEVRCEEQAGMADEYDSTELVCGACSDVSRAQMCPKHGTDFLEYKCRYCCSVAVFFCFGTTHFCNACHDDFQRVANMPKGDLPHCPAGPKAKQLEGDECPLHVKHPPTGEEFALGCGVCRNAHTF
ncbi:hypothetical protein CAPTEDRAFT_222007 [Capitella teleta]|uniref:RCR-type E3 ubiquitin transferase n=1 Tax=Capitella teleta TaxID=283909 RepID=R7VJZ8_CAPTE|nr:hypothetical protein CAPTEDRAFT_222007 [Capitella teleta]|eukprot:ELU16916.1 hypothetical protein CAPTEDRAFT_222007 [Capitella teleta]